MGAPKTIDGKPIYSEWPTEESRVTEYSHNWCDKTTWYDAAMRVVDEEATRNDSTHYQVEHTHIIDTYHGKLTGEDYLLDSSGNSFRVTVKIAGVTKTERDPHFGSGGDYEIDYATGIITFFTAVDEGDVVLVTYHYATTSVFILSPASGKRLSIKRVEAQFSSDVVLNDTVIFQLYGLASIFAPQLGLPEGTKIPLGNPNKYKSFMDFVNESDGCFPTIPAISTGWRGVPVPIVTLPWQYISLLELKSSLGLEIQLSLEHDEPFSGFMATATFYCFSLDE